MGSGVVSPIKRVFNFADEESDTLELIKLLIKMPGDLAGTEQRWFTTLNQVNFTFGIFYTIYQIFMTIFSGFRAVFTVFIFLFCAALLLSAGCSNRLKNSDKGICMYFILTLGLFAWVVILIVICFI